VRALSVPRATAGQREKHVQERRHAAVPFDLVAQRQRSPHFIPVSSSLAEADQVPRLFQLGDDPLHGALGDTHGLCDVAEELAERWFPHYAMVAWVTDVAVVREHKYR